MSEEYFEEEDFQTKFTGKTFRRILGLTKPHWKWVVGFLVAIATVSGLDSFFTYLSKRIIDEGIIATNREVLVNILYNLWQLIGCASHICLLLYLF